MTSLSYFIQLVLSIRILAKPCGPEGEEDAVKFVDVDAGDANDGDVCVSNLTSSGRVLAQLRDINCRAAASATYVLTVSNIKVLSNS